jgi:hypothetical protein
MYDEESPVPFSGPEFRLSAEAAQWYSGRQLTDAQLAVKHKVKEIDRKHARRAALLTGEPQPPPAPVWGDQRHE